LRAQHAGRELPVALLVGDLRRQPHGGGSDGPVLQPEPTGRVLRARGRRRRRLARRRDDPLHREQLRDAARRWHLRADPLEASRADAVRAEEPPPPDGAERGGPAMTGNRNDLNAAVAAGVLGSEERFRALLRSVVEVARAIFAARASSVLLPDEASNELVFEAVVGEGEERLLGVRFPAGTGVAGWVLATRTPLVIEDVRRDPRFAKDVAEGTGYVPEGLMAVPLLHEERALGVLEVLDRKTKFTLEEMELLGLFGAQAAIALDLLQRAREAEAALAGDGRLAVVARVAAALESREDEAGARLLAALEEVL